MGTEMVKENLKGPGILRNGTEKSTPSKHDLYIMESNGCFRSQMA